MEWESIKKWKRKNSMVMKRFLACFVLVMFVSFGFVLASGDKDFGVDSALLKMAVREGEVVSKGLNVIGYSGGDFNVEAKGLGFVSVDRFFSLDSGEEKMLDLKFNSSGMEPGIYFGELVISSGDVIAVPIIFEVESTEVLFDSSISVPLEYSKVYAGGSLVAENKIFNLENIGLKNIDVHYFVGDFKGNSLFSEDENLVVDSQVLSTKSVSLSEDVVPGDYLFGVVLKYKDSVGTSSYFFRVSEEEEVVVSTISDENYFLWVVVILLIVLVFFIIYYLRQRDKVFLELNRQYRNEVRKQECGKVKPRELKKRLVVIRKIYRDRIKVVRVLKRHKRVNEVDKKLAEWEKQGYNVDEFLTKEGRGKEDLKKRVGKYKREGYKL